MNTQITLQHKGYLIGRMAGAHVWHLSTCTSVAHRKGVPHYLATKLRWVFGLRKKWAGKIFTFLARIANAPMAFRKRDLAKVRTKGILHFLRLGNFYPESISKLKPDIAIASK